MDSLESVLSNSSKLMIDIKAGNNLMLLPLDKIISSPEISQEVEEENIDNEYTEKEENIREGR